MIRRSLLAMVIVGVLLGWATARVNHVGPGARYLALVLDSAWLWATFGYAAALFARTFKRAFIQCFGLLSAAVFTYFATDLAFGVYTSAPIYDVDGPERVMWVPLLIEMVIYLVVAAVASLGLGWSSIRARQPGVLGYAAMLLLPVYISWAQLTSYFRYQRIPDSCVEFAENNFVAGWVGFLASVVATGLFVIRIMADVRSRRFGRAGQSVAMRS